MYHYVRCKAVKSVQRREVNQMETFLIIVQALLSLALIAIIMMQSGKEAGLSGALAGNSDSYLSKNGMGGLDKKLAASTKWFALAWIVLTLILSLI